MTVLDGVRVLDLTAGDAGSLAAAMFADFGADVVRVTAEDPRRDRAALRPDWVVHNRSKRIALATPAATRDRDDVRGLAGAADVIVADSRGDLAAYGLLDLLQDDRRIVVLTPPYTEDETPWAGGGEAPELLNMISGLAFFQASHSGRPVDSVYPYLTSIQGFWAATCALSALFERCRSGRGQVVVTSGMHAASVFGCALYSRPEGEPDPDRAIGPGGLNPMYTRYRASDGRWFLIGGLGPKFSAAVVKVTKSEHLLDDPRIENRIDRLWHLDNSRWVMDHFATLFRSEPAAHWIGLLESAGVPVTLLSDRTDWFDSEQNRSIAQRIDADDPVLGPVALPGNPVASDLTPAHVAAPAASRPVADVHWHARPSAPEVRHEPGKGAGKGPLSGIRIASFGSFVAGPYAAGLLAELGAEVVKVEPLDGDPWRMQGFAYNRGVRSLAVDLRRPDGLAAARAVLSGCDLVLDNFRLGVMGRLGLGRDQLSAVNPGVITVAMTAYGEKGPMAALPGYDTVLQAVSGIMTAQGGDDEPVLFSLPPIDHTAAVIAAFASVLALYHRERTGQGQHVCTSLAAAATAVQASDLIDYRGRRARRAGGRDFPGPTAADRVYDTVGGFVRLQADAIDAGRWRAVGLAVDAARLAADPVAEVARVLASLTAEEAVARLGSAGVRAVRARPLSAVVADPSLHERGLLVWDTTPSGVQYSTVGRMAGFSRTQVSSQLRAPGLGEHSRDVLLAAGYQHALVEQLVRDGTVRTSGPLDIEFLPEYR